MSENTINEVEQTAVGKTIPTVQTADELKKALLSDFATGVTKVYVNSLGKEIAFKEISVIQQKNLSRIMIGNEQRKDIIYDAQCGAINEACLADGFNIYDLTEFDRLKLLIVLYQSNMFSTDVKFTCKECGTENTYKPNFENVLYKLDQIDLTPTKFHYENKNFVYDFTVAYPSVKLVSSFHKHYFAKHKITSKKDIKVNDSMSNIEYIDLFIQKIDLTIKSTGTTKNIDFSQYKASEVEEILQVFPQDVLYSDQGVLTYISNEYLKKLNDAFEKHQCIRCGTIQEDDQTNQVEGFL